MQNRDSNRQNQNRAPRPPQKPRPQPAAIPPPETKIIALDVDSSAGFIANVICDIVHDSATGYTTTAVDITTIAISYACWLKEVNVGVPMSLLALALFILKCYRERNIIGKSVEENNKRQLDALRKVSVDLPAEMIIDSCSAGVAHCSDRAAHALSTYSTFFDTGSSSQTCGNIARGKYFSNTSAPISTAAALGTRFINYDFAVVDRSRPMYGSVIPRCNNAVHAQVPPTAFYIIGKLKLDAGDPAQVVLAYRGVVVMPTSGAPSVTYSFRYGSRINDVITYGWSVSASDVREMVARWRSAIISYFAARNASGHIQHDIDDYGAMENVVRMLSVQLSAEVFGRSTGAEGAAKLFVHASAKLWGDLGLVCEAVGEDDRYVVTRDKMLAVFSATLGANYFWDGSARMPDVRPRVIRPAPGVMPLEMSNNTEYAVNKRIRLAEFFSD